MSEDSGEYGVRFSTGSRRFTYAIDREDYESAREAVSKINAFTQFETLFEVLAESYVAFERELALAAIDRLYLYDQTDKDIFLPHTRFNVGLLTVLSAVRTYHDQRKRIIGSVGEQVSKDIEQEFCRAFDENLEYRVMELLRNYSQHQDLPIHSVTIRHDNQHKDDSVSVGVPSRNRIVVQPKVNISLLIKARRKLRAKTVSELEALDEAFLDIKWYLRKYVSLLARAHSFAQGKFEEVELGARQELIKLRKLALGSQDFLDSEQEIILELISTGHEIEVIYADVELIERLEKRRNRFRDLANVHRAFISNELVADGKSNYGGQVAVWIP